MNKFYVLLPAVLLITFGVYYTKVAKPEMAAQALAQEQRIAREKDEETRKKADIDRKAQEDARARQAEKDKKDRERQEKARLDKEEQDRKIHDETAKFENEAARFTKQIADLEIEITKLRSRRDQLNGEVLEVAKKVELTKIERRNAELDIQRMYDIVAQKVAASALAKAPPPLPK
jgi:hypothetical protein